MTRTELAAIYDPSLTLNPAQGVSVGVSLLMSTAADVRTEALERVGDVDAGRG
ncbi:hypothetical protein SAMN05421505_101160 [Sinosporangium album]|uniref:Uncharacterized protein n=1 Tax=Sinosporangium album TaxID=504805 RepID=A0A1G7QX45_9ACTN|nr:hypothetical protein [Sinosporangium album]SDG03098.1 hypothetical protein SAMN05421505_101160 [Sinosporangium album]